jgi:acetate kinase
MNQSINLRYDVYNRESVMTDGDFMRILTINSGSSSIKFALYRMGRVETQMLSGSAGGIGFASGLFHIKDADGKTMIEKKLDLRDHHAALQEIINWLRSSAVGQEVDAVGHRLVHGGSAYTEPHLITDPLLTALDELTPFAPDHLPHEIHAIKEFSRSYPALKQVACFDTAFHRTMPEVAQRYALPGEVRRHGILRYGFHGLSYEYILSELRKTVGPETADGRVIIAHLGNGASMAAFRRGKSMDTTMGFTPAGGLVMSTRSGDLDPGVIVYLLKDKGMDVSTLNRMINKQAGLLGVSGTSSDMKELLDRESEDPPAAEAVELFCYQAKKFLGALAAVLGGLDTLIFTGGIGENAPSIRRRICQDTEFLGIRLDPGRNGSNAPLISMDAGPVAVRVMKTNEELMIARHTYSLVMKKPGGNKA